MSRKRIFTVHVNIDDMTALIAGLDGQEEKADWIDGYMVGVHGHPSRETWPPAKRGGYDFGARHFAEAEEFRAAQAAKSALGVAAKQAKINPDCTHGLPAGAPAEAPNPTIQQSNNPTNEQTKEPRTRFVPPTLDELTAYAKEIGFRDVDKWMNHYASNGWMVGKNKMKDWKACVRNWNLNPIQRQGFRKPGPKLNGFTPEYMEQGRIVRNDGLDF